MRVNDVDLELARIDAELAELRKEKEEALDDAQTPVDAALGFLDALLGVGRPALRPRTPAASFGRGPAASSKKGCGGCIGRRK